jgi:hypothetical protein
MSSIENIRSFFIADYTPSFKRVEAKLFERINPEGTGAGDERRKEPAFRQAGMFFSRLLDREDFLGCLMQAIADSGVGDEIVITDPYPDAV